MVYNKIMKKILFILASCFLLLTPTLTLAQSIDLLWQGDGYVPPFYSGRNIWSKQSKITLLAIPHGLGNPIALNYKWTKTGTVLGGASGIGRNSIFFIDNVLSKPQTFKVEIIKGKNEIVASASLTLTPLSPSLLVYENNPLYGFMFHKEAGSDYRLNEREVTFTAFPILFGALSRTDNAISYTWRTNAGAAETGNSVTYRTMDNISGSSEVSVTVSNKDKFIQEAEKNFLVQFGEQNE